MEDLIIIVPTYNKPDNLSRICEYYSSFPCKVYVCDSSKTEASVQQYSNIVYNWCPEFNFYQKVINVIENTNGAYYALTPDDDFMKESTLKECYLKIKEDTKYSMGIGFQVFFHEPFDNQLFTLPKSNMLAGLNEMRFENEDEYIDYFWSHYQNILWSVYRKEVLLSAFSCLHSSNIGYGNMIEFVVGIECLKTGLVYVSKNALNYRERTQSFHWGAVAPVINSVTIDTDPTIKSNTENMLRYYSQTGEEAFARKCLLSYIKSHTLTPLKSITTKIRSLVPKPLKPFVYTLLQKMSSGTHSETPYNDSEMLNKISTVMKH